ncbi:hypothetical protein B566_EDAN016119 [Ephemera danica]|nr:hypothetical protein B566_EDAN016119 [Ephemera danica]
MTKMTEKGFTYKRTEGVDSSHGSDYERELQSLVYLRCLNMHSEWTKTGNSGLKSFYLANNVKHIGVFDDVVLKVESVVDDQVKPKLIFVQEVKVDDASKNLIGNQEDSHPGQQLENITDFVDKTKSDDELTKRPSPIHSDSDDDGTESSTDIEFLLYDGCVGARDNSEDTDLHYDSRQSSTERCDMNMQICDRECNTVLHYASRNGNKEIMHLLLQRDITLINRQNMHGETPLHIAIEENNFDATHYLLSIKECLVNLQNNTGDTVLHYAVKCENFDEIDIEENSKQITTSPQFEYTEKTCIPGPSSVDIKCQDSLTKD